MEIPSYFEDFLPLISPTKRQREVMIREHKKLRELLMADDQLKPILLSTFIQGSQRRSTAIQGDKEHPCDVDVVAVTNIPRSPTTAAHAHRVFQPFLERHYKGQYEAQDRSWCITVDPEVKVDLVPTSEPDSKELREAVIAKGLGDWDPDASIGLKRALGIQSLTEAVLEEARRDKDWEKSEPLWIPDRTLRTWEKTHPLFLIGWTAQKNLLCDGRFGHVVKIIKWWRRHMEPLPKYPKGYPLEHIIGDCCPNGIKSIAEGIVGTFDEILRRYASDAAIKRTPFLPARGVSNPEVDVMRRVTGEDFAGFYTKVRNAADLARAALQSDNVRESALLWRKLLGPVFPKPPEEKPKVTGGYTPPSAPARPQEGRFA